MFKIKRISISVYAIILALMAPQLLAIDNNLFPRPAAIEKDVQFWIKVFTDVDSKQGYIHDDQYLGVIYEKINVPQGLNYRQKQQYINKRKERYERILSKLATGKTSGLDKEERRVLALWPKSVTLKTLRTAKNRIRFQLGQADKYLAGLIRSGAWKKHIIKTLDEMGLPREISSLPHVESSFNPKAYSKVGAAGLWQFTRYTGRRFMRVDHVVDERMDPFKASVAAARLLENNYSVTGTWPLALTAYNHGAAGMRRAAQKTGTTDITTILRTYKSRSFKFASRNFYVAFLAAVEVEQNAKKYFGNVKLNPPIEDELIKVPGYMSIRDISKILGVSISYLRSKNPALRPLVWKNQKYVPRGYELRIGKADLPAPASQLVAKLAASRMYANQKRDRYHRVRRGQTLSYIARRYGVRIRDLMAVNNLRSKHRIRIGQTLRLPHRGGTMVASRSTSSSKSRQIPSRGYHKVRRGDTVQKIARRYNVSIKQILAYNNLHRRSRIYPGQRLRLKPYPQATTVASTGIYKVRRGDSVEKIAKRYNLDVGDILAYNNLNRRSRIYPGQKLRVKQIEEPKTVVASADTDTSATDSETTETTTETTQASETGETGSEQPVQVAQLDTVSSETADADADSDNEDKSTETSSAAKAERQDLAAEENISDEGEVETAAGEADTGETTAEEADTGETAEEEESVVATSAEQAPAQDELSSGAIGADTEVITENVVVVSDTELPDETTVTAASDVDQLDDSTVEKVASLQAVEKPSSPTLDEVLDEQINAIEQGTAFDESSLVADPTDYSVFDNSTIEVQAAETLGHYADWLNIATWRLRRANKMRFGKPVIIGKRIKLIFKKVSKEEFEKRRRSYHQTLQEEFFKEFEISGSDKHTIRRGESVWALAKRKYKIPIWLLRQYNPDLKLNRIIPGTVVKFPKVVEKAKEVSKLEQTLADATEKAGTAKTQTSHLP